MIEIHSHLLPGIDDGPDDLATSLQMAQIYIQQGVQTVICTPHFDLQNFSDQQSLAAGFARIQAAQIGLARGLKEQQMDLQLLLGLEIRLTADLLPLLKVYNQQYPMTLAGTGYILIELPSWQSNDLASLDHLLYNMQLAGYIPILAHPERTLTATRPILQTLTNWVRQERLLLQINASSLLNLPLTSPEQEDRHRRYRNLANQLLDLQLVHFVASDAHHPQSRPPRNRQAYEALAKQYSKTLADQLTQHNPESLLADQPIVL